MIDFAKHWMFAYPLQRGAKLYYKKKGEYVKVEFIAFVPQYKTIIEALSIYGIEIDVSHLKPDDWRDTNHCLVYNDRQKVALLPENKLFDATAIYNTSLLDNKWMRESARLSKITVDDERLSHKFGRNGCESYGRIVSRDLLISIIRRKCKYFNSTCGECLVNRELFCDGAYDLAAGKGMKAW